MSQMDAQLVNAEVTKSMGKFLEAMGRLPASKDDYREARQHLAELQTVVRKAQEWFEGEWLDDVRPEASPTFPCLLGYENGWWLLAPKKETQGIYSRMFKDFLGTMKFENCEDMVKYGITLEQASEVFTHPEDGPIEVQYRLRQDEEVRDYPEED